MPDTDDLTAILASKLDQAFPREALRPFCEPIAGTVTGADATRVALEAKRLARRSGREVDLADLAAVMRPVDRRPESVRRVIAVHEAGHVVAALTLGVIPHSASLMESPVGGGSVCFTSTPVTAMSGHTCRRDILITLAGRAAEEIVVGTVSAGSGGHAESDLAAATGMAGRFEGAYGFGSSLVFHKHPERRIVESILRRAYSDALALVVRHRSAVTAFADLLLSARVLGKDRIIEFGVRHGLTDNDSSIRQKADIQ